MKGQKLIFSLVILMVIYQSLLLATGTINKFPDELVLDTYNSLNFRLWFVSIALDNVDNKHPTFKTEDCSGFVFYAIKEALKKHDNNWFEKTKYKGPIFEDVKKYNYPETPFGVNIFYDGKSLVSYVNAHHLLLFNTKFISFEKEFAKPGDIIFFFHPEDPDFPYHVMIYTGNGFVYHTGPDGEIRYVKYENMMIGDMAWRPIRLNPAFLGYFRLLILSD